ncbi:type I iodothyronine deiodinase isoform X4 [Ascaphus truei]|uniref:type I iodothyronine deiodinase isoform X4 n=1 Tax=Ascaphus truei TaxID=8439 RepID=UPI003F5AA90D
MGSLLQVISTVALFVQKSLILCSLLLYVAFGRVLMILFPQTMASVLKSHFKMTGTHHPKFQYEDWGHTFFTYKFLRTVLQIMWLRLEDEAFLGHAAPNMPVVGLSGDLHHIWDYLKDLTSLTSWFGISTLWQIS